MEKVQIISTSEKFDLAAPAYDNTLNRYFEQWDGRALINMLGDVSEKFILDIGCGTGRLLKKLQGLGANTVGIDISKQMVEKARSKSLLVFQTDINQFEWREPFDIILSVLTFNYIEDKATAFEKIWSLLKSGGIFVISSDLQVEDTVARRGNELVAAKYFPLSQEHYCELLKQTGYEIEASSYLFWSEEFKDYCKPDIPIGFTIKARKPSGSY